MAKALQSKAEPEARDIELKGSDLGKEGFWRRDLRDCSALSLSIGIDLIEVSKVKKVFGKREALREAVFTQEELRFSMRQRAPLLHLAERFAVKEAFFKALGTGLSLEMDWRDVEVRGEITGKPTLGLRGGTGQIAHDKGMVGYSLSFSHTAEYAVALVLIVISGPSQ